MANKEIEQSKKSSELSDTTNKSGYEEIKKRARGNTKERILVRD